MPVPLHRLAWIAVRAALGPPKRVGRLRHRVWPRYIDLYRHMNQAAYLEIMEAARWDWMIRARVAQHWFRSGLAPVVVGQQITYRRELRPLVGFVVDTRAVGFHRRAVRMEQHFLVGDRVHAAAVVDMVVLRDKRVAPFEEVRASVEEVLSRPFSHPRGVVASGPSE